MQTSELLKELRIDRNGRAARARGRWLALAAAAVLALAGGLWLAWGRVSPPTVRTVHARAAAPAAGPGLANNAEQIRVARESVAVAQVQLDNTVILAPFSGVVIAKAAQPGEMISPISAGGGFTRTGIGTIVDMDSLEIQVDVNESYINRVVSGPPVQATLNAYPDWTIPGSVIAIIPTADRSRATVKVRIAIPSNAPP